MTRYEKIQIKLVWFFYSQEDIQYSETQLSEHSRAFGLYCLIFFVYLFSQRACGFLGRIHFEFKNRFIGNLIG